MNNLKSLFNNFTKALQNSTQEITLLNLKEPTYFAIYKKNIEFNHISILKMVYPITQKLVGEDFFNTAAHFYCQHFPAINSNFNFYGAYFSEFLKTYPPIQKLQYVYEMAEVEWLLHHVYHSAPPITVTFPIENIKKNDYAHLIFTLEEHCYLIKCKHTILGLWQSCQQQEEDNIFLKREKEYLMIYATSFTTTIEKLTFTEFLLLQELKKGKTLDKVNKTLLARVSKFDINAIIEKFIKKGMLKFQFIHNIPKL